ncbi:hypothetical protein GCM10020219_006140 [Nonomuraea dietziae]
MPEGAARAYLRDLPDAELHLLEGGHWALETNLDEIVALTRDFLGRLAPGTPASAVVAVAATAERLAEMEAAGESHRDVAAAVGGGADVEAATAEAVADSVAGQVDPERAHLDRLTVVPAHRASSGKVRGALKTKGTTEEFPDQRRALPPSVLRQWKPPGRLTDSVRRPSAVLVTRKALLPPAVPDTTAGQVQPERPYLDGLAITPAH